MKKIRTRLTDVYHKLSDESKANLDKTYMVFLSNKSCIVCKAKPIEKHHIRNAENSGTAMKPPDVFCIPLQKEFHTGDKGIHKLGLRLFEKEHNISIKKKLDELHEEFLSEVLHVE